MPPRSTTISPPKHSTSRRAAESGTIETLQNRARGPIRTLAIYLVTIAGCAIAAEGISRLVHWNARPMIPYQVDRAGAARLPPLVQFPVKMPGYPRIELVTDELGSRVADVIARGRDRSVLFVGDSQVLGWGLPFEATMATRSAAKLGLHASDTSILAAATQDPSSIRAWAEDYSHRHRERHRLVVIGLNLGNDLEELAFGSVKHSNARTAFTNWMAIHSTLYLDWALLKQRVAPGLSDQALIGVNVAMVSTTVDRFRLASVVVDRLSALIRSLPEADQVVVALLPQDSQVEIREFEKYRYAYPNAAEFARYRDLQRVAITRLDETARAIMQELSVRGVMAVDVAPALRARPGPELFDRTSHHLLAAGHELVADILVSALRRQQ